MNVEEYVNLQLRIHGNLRDCAVDIGNCHTVNESCHVNNWRKDLRNDLGRTYDTDFLFNYGDGSCADK